MNLDYINKSIEKSAFNNEEIADLIGVSRATIFNYKSGRCDIPATKLDKLIKLLNLDLTKIF